MNIAIIGSRSFNDYELLKDILNRYQIMNGSISKIISGGAKGADALAERYAKEYNIEIKIHYADWENFGKRAGFIRNVDIWNDSDIGFAFWDGESKGTKHSFEISKKQNKKLFVYEYITGKMYLI